MSVAKARVWNDHTEEHVEEFRGEIVKIPPKGFVEMPWPSAVQFRGQYTPILRDGLGRDLKPKKIRLERIDDAAPKFAAPASKFTCQACNKACKTQKELDDHIAKQHVEQMVDEDAREEFEKSTKNGK
jgi:hypothetical protein